MLHLAVIIMAVPVRAATVTRLPSVADAIGVRLTSNAAVTEDGRRIAIESEGLITVIDIR
jgi:hypothetical protein